MRLSRFINEHIDEIITEWESFAKTLGPAADDMSTLALRDHAKGILQAISADIESWQNPELQYQKSKGLVTDPAEQSAASIHGALRQASSFSLLQLSAEYRALRATVLRLWLPTVKEVSINTNDEMVRFNEAIDQALAESIVTYSARADQTRDLFLAILGHDLRNPLSAMTMAGALLMRPEVAPGEFTKIGARVKRNADLMSAMVNDLLGYSQAQLGSGMPITRQAADLNEICENVIDNMRLAHPSNQFSFDTSGDMTGIFDGVRCYQLLANLLSNAVQYGDRERPIAVTASAEPDAVTIEVQNHGCAIPQADLATVFTPLVQLSRDDEEETRPKTSLGLGLFVAREIAQAHGGTITVSSNDTDGTRFVVRLPRLIADVA